MVILADISAEALVKAKSKVLQLVPDAKVETVVRPPSSCPSHNLN